MADHNRWRIARLLIFALVVAPALLLAQEKEQVLTINLGGGASQKTVSASTGGSRQPLGVAKPGAPFKLDMNALNIGKGKRVNIVSQGENLLLVPQGTTDAGCETAKSTGQGDQCRKLGALVWGESTTLGLSGMGGVLELTGGFHAPRFTLGLGYAFQNYNKLDDVACDMTAIPGLTGCSSDNSGSGIAAFVEYQLIDHLRIGVGFRSSGYLVNQEFGGQLIDQDVSVNIFDGYLQYRPLNAVGLVDPFFSLGWAFLDNSSELFDADGEILDSRSENGLRLFGSTGIDFRLGNRFGLRAAGEYRSGGSGDADSQFGAATSITLNF